MAAELLKSGHSVPFVMNRLELHSDWRNRLVTELIKHGDFDDDQIRVLSVGAMAVHLGKKKEDIEAHLHKIPHTVVEGRPMIDLDDAGLVEELLQTHKHKAYKPFKREVRAAPRMLASFNTVPIEGDPHARRWEMAALEEIRNLPPFDPQEPVIGVNEIADRYNVPKNTPRWWVRRGLLESMPMAYRCKKTGISVAAVRMAALEVILKHFPYEIADHREE